MSEENKKELKTVKVVKVKAKTVTAKPVAKQSTEPKQIRPQPPVQRPVEQKTAIQARSEQTQPLRAQHTAVLKQEPRSKQTPPQRPAPKQAPPRQQSTAERLYNMPIYNRWWFWLIMALTILGIVAVFKYGVPYANQGASTESAQGTVVESEDKDNALNVNEGLLTVEMTIPPEFFEDETKEEIEASAKTKGILECTVNEDGSVTYKMTRAKRRELLKEMKASIDETIQEYLGGGEDAPQSFKSITYNSSVTKFDVRVDRAIYENSIFDSMYALGLYFAGGYYQLFDGVSADQMDVIVNFIDDSTGEVIESGSLKAFMENTE